MTVNRTFNRTSSRTSSIFLGETWTLALQALQANKVRALLTMLGVIIGSGCIVMVVTIGLAGRRYIISQIESVGANLVYATVVRAGVSRPITLDDQISPADLNAIKDSIPQINEVAGTNDVPMSVAVNGKERPINLVGVTVGSFSADPEPGNPSRKLFRAGRFALAPKDLPDHSRSRVSSVSVPESGGGRHSSRRTPFYGDRRFQGTWRNFRAD